MEEWRYEMNNVWAFLLQTAYVSLVGLLLLMVKWLLRDKLPARWQYFVWVVLAVRLLVPATLTKKAALLPLPLWVETLRILAEGRWSSAYLESGQAVQVAAPVPWLTGLPSSITDWLFVLYFVGMLVFFGYILRKYLHLRRLVEEASPPPEKVRRQVMAVGERYNLPLCNVVVSSDLTTSMICGVFRPVLVLPKEREVEDHVILHELLHLQHHDALQHVFWTLCRGIHWCNPLVHWLLNRVGNDLESLCDQRVLERLVGEECRTYGISLRSMKTEQYDQIPGTTSISNGSQAISHRTKAVAHPRSYPKGINLVSCCVTAVLLTTCLVGTLEPPLALTRGGTWAETKALAAARLTSCSTVAGAVDAYAKGLIEGSWLYLIAASPAQMRGGLTEEYRLQGLHFFLLQNQEFPYYTVHVGKGVVSEPTKQMTTCTFTGEPYTICGLNQEEDDSYSALLVLPVKAKADRANVERQGTLVYPIQIFREAGHGYVVEQAGTEVLYLSAEFGAFYDGNQGYPFLAKDKHYEGVGESGRGTASVQRLYRLDHDSKMLVPPDFSPDAQKDFVIQEVCFLEYTVTGRPEEGQGLTELGLQAIKMEEGEPPDFSEVEKYSCLIPGSSGSGDRGYCWSATAVSENGKGSVTGTQEGQVEEGTSYPAGFALRVFWNREVRETLFLQEVREDET